MKKDGYTIDDTGCWIWNNACDKAGCGVAWLNGKFIRAHRLSYIFFKGDPTGTNVLHTCDVKNCVNPDHLFLGSNQDNSTDMVKKNRQAKGEKTGSAKLTEKEVKEIRITMIGVPSRIVAKLYGISKTNVLDIRKHKIWKHI